MSSPPNVPDADVTERLRDVTVLDLLDRILDRGVILTGNLTISVADVDLIALELRLLLASAERLQQLGVESPSGPLELSNGNG